MRYIMDNHEGYTFEPEYKQIFQNKWVLNIAHDEIVKMRNNRIITDTDLSIVTFLFKFRFTTAEMMFRYLGEGSTLEATEERLERLVKNRILNKFMLSMDSISQTIPTDAFQIYCLDVGGRTLLTHYSNENTTNWYTTENMKGAEVISRDLITSNFYIKVMQTCPDKVKHFKLNPKYRLGRKATIPSFEMGLIVNDQLRYFIGEVVRDSDFPTLFRERLESLESIIATQAWKKYFYDMDSPPPVFVFAEDDKNALDVSEMVHGTTEITSMRFTTDDRLLRELGDVGTFLRYNPEEGRLQEIKATIFD